MVHAMESKDNMMDKTLLTLMVLVIEQKDWPPVATIARMALPLERFV